MFFGGSENFVDRLLDTEVYCVVPVVAEDNFNQVLANVMNVAANGGKEYLALARLVRFLDARF